MSTLTHLIQYKYVKNIFMRKFSIILLIDYILKFFLLFFINLIWCLYFITPKWLSLIIAIISASLILFLFKIINNKKTLKNKPKLAEIKHMEDIKNTFIYMSSNKILSFFENLAKSKHEAFILNDYVVIKKDFPIILFPYFKNKSLDIDKLIEIVNSINLDNIKKLIVLCNTHENNLLACLENFNTKVIVLDYKQTYMQLLKPYEFFPEILIREKPKAKTTINQILCYAFNKKRTRGYIVSSLFILFASYFTIYRIYYLIFSTILLVFAILCRFEFKFNKIDSEQLMN